MTTRTAEEPRVLRTRSLQADEGLARLLGWFSLGLGLAELLAPRGLARLAGVPERSGLIRLMGLREAATGVALLAQPAAGPVWARVGGDAVDLALLGASFLRRNGDGGARTAAALAAVAGITAVDVACAASLERRQPRAGRRPRAVVTIDRPADACYAAWRGLDILPCIWPAVEAVEPAGEGRVAWTLRRDGAPVRAELELSEDAPGRRLAWRTAKGAPFATSGTIRFDEAFGGRGTVVRLEADVDAARPPLAARILGRDEPHELLRRFKQWMETGEIATSRAQPAGRRGPLDRILQKAEAPT